MKLEVRVSQRGGAASAELGNGLRRDHTRTANTGDGNFVLGVTAARGGTYLNERDR